MNVRFIKESLKKNIKEAVKFLLNIRGNYKYSRITDFITKNDKIEKEENKEIAIHQICKNKQFDKCCVCYEFNSILINMDNELFKYYMTQIFIKQCLFASQRISLYLK